ncbi:hypothetical protein Pcinc_006393 [Petrolisthes cinctipes]|uniref:Uncharacterized protein n=1 Tax=Petrolisthes cinctipes TaxID=88211 RepID=A0AAE1KYE6_PETCI|nr:hypothetical protein Pcinc_006393 [Petrolisthes cinctipes]
MIREGHVSLQSFLLGLGILSYYIVACASWSSGLGVVSQWLAVRPWAFCLAFYLAVNVIIALIFSGAEWQIAVRGCFLGSACGVGVMGRLEANVESGGVWY